MSNETNNRALDPTYEKGNAMGPVVNKGHHEFMLNRIETAINDGAELFLDGRNAKVDDSLKNSYYSRTVAKEIHGAMVGIFGFTGQKQSFSGDPHEIGRDGFTFFTKSKNVISTWIPEGVNDQGKVDTWDGTMKAIKSR